MAGSGETIVKDIKKTVENEMPLWMVRNKVDGINNEGRTRLRNPPFFIDKILDG
jgi:hypothetical protein